MIRLAACLCLLALAGCIPTPVLPVVAAGLGFGTAVVVFDTDVFNAMEKSTP